MHVSEPTPGFHHTYYHHRPGVDNLKSAIEESPNDPGGSRHPMFEGGGKTRIGKKLSNRLATTAITIIVFLPTLAYLGTVVAAGHTAPNYCNNAGGCPWTN